ncbi:MAG: hypothetical protein B6D56_05125 [Candidatus Omnitrophica bacterium 4484_70.1]|nr:MAG: hypothetical protein B6D56_05125 [Candidatus Omnitrophica bacterium 4484_70.1]
MGTFIYKAKNGPDNTIEGKMSAANVQEVVDRLNKQGYVATYVKEENIDRGISFPFWGQLIGKVTLKELIVFSQQLGFLLKAKVPILKALKILSQQIPNLYFRGVIKELTKQVKNGQPLSTSLKKYPKIFSSFYTTMVGAGEESGTLDKALMRITGYYVKQLEFISKVKSALTYPLLVLTVGFITLIFIFTKVIPRIIPLLKSLDIPLPFPTKVLISISSFLVDNWFFLVLGGLLLVLIWRKACYNKMFTYHLSILKLNLPILGQLIFKSEFARFARTLEISLQSGVPLVKGWEFSLPIIKEEVIRNNLEESLKVLKSGGRLCETLKGDLFPPLVYNLVEIGEESGELEEAFSNIAQWFENDCQEFIRLLTTVLEPMMVLVVGLIIGFIVAAVLLPIFQLDFMQM